MCSTLSDKGRTTITFYNSFENFAQMRYVLNSFSFSSTFNVNVNKLFSYTGQRASTLKKTHADGDRPGARAHVQPNAEPIGARRGWPTRGEGSEGERPGGHVTLGEPTGREPEDAEHVNLNIYATFINSRPRGRCAATSACPSSIGSTSPSI